MAEQSKTPVSVVDFLGTDYATVKEAARSHKVNVASFMAEIVRHVLSDDASESILSDCAELATGRKNRKETVAALKDNVAQLQAQIDALRAAQD